MFAARTREFRKIGRFRLLTRSQRTSLFKQLLLLTCVFVLAVPAPALWPVEPGLSSRHNDIPRVHNAMVFTTASTPMGNGLVRTWVRSDLVGKPEAIGVTFSEAALAGLPASLTPGLIWTEFLLALPTEAGALPYNHVGLNWNPRGHDPEGVYNVPHFDFHFYLITPDERRKITARGDDLTRTRKLLPPEMVPEGYVAPPGAEEPGMGLHWVEQGSHEFHGKAFTHTFIYGSYDGEIIFLEPMITKAFLESKANITVPVKSAKKVVKPGYYPTHYSVKYDPLTKEYTVALEGLTAR